MQNYTRQYREDRTTFINGAQVSQATNQLAYDTVFTTSGFGPGNFVDPVAGSFQKVSRKLMNGISRKITPTTDTYTVGPNPNTGAGQGTPPPALDLTLADYTALKKLYAKVSGNHGYAPGGNQSTTNAAVTVGEGRETYHMVKNAAKAARHVATWAKKAVASVTRKGRIVGDVSQAWLAYSYGWRPLLGEIHGFAEWSTRRFKDYTFRGTGHTEANHYHYVKLSGFNYIGTTSVGYSSGRVLYSVTCSVTDENAFDLSRLTSLDPKLIAWELLPLSFVLDWFVGIGDYLEMQEQALARGLTFVRGFKTVTTLVEYTAHLSGAEKQGNDLYFRDFKARSRTVNKSRTKLTGFPRPALPVVKVNLGWRRILSGGALTATALGLPPHPRIKR